MTLQYTAVGIQNESHMATSIDDYWKDLERLQTSIGYAVWNCSLDLPVRLVTVSEGGIGGWCLGGGDEHIRISREVVPEIPGKETEFLGALCKEFNIYLIAQMVAKAPDLMKDRIFNIAFMIDPNGEVIHQHIKTSFIKEKQILPQVIYGTFI